MQKHTFASCLIIAFWATNLASAGDSEPSKLRPVATYSIVARDPITGQLGVAVQSHWFSVGSVVTWARAGVGAVATQSVVLVDYGPQGRALIHDPCKVVRGGHDGYTGKEVSARLPFFESRDALRGICRRCVTHSRNAVGEELVAS